MSAWSPGKPGAYQVLFQCVDAALLAQAIVWMATEPACANQAFNITNGDLIRWENVWRSSHVSFGMELGQPRQISLTRMMADKEPVWKRIVAQHRLEANDYAAIAAWPFGDYVFGCDFDIISDMGKARRYGFNACVDTEDMFVRLFTRFREQRIIP